MPYDADLERFVLGSAMWSRDDASDAISVLDPIDFFEDRHRAVFQAITDLFLEDGEISPLLVKDRLHRNGTWGHIEHPDVPGSGKTFLLDLIADAYRSIGDASVAKHARAIKRHALMRELSGVLGPESWQLADTELRDAATKAADLLAEINAPRDTRDHMALFGERFMDFLEELELRSKHSLPAGVPTGLRGLDEGIGGLKGGQFIVVGSRPSMGKTALKLGIALEAARRTLRVAFFTLEMSPTEIKWRALSQLTHVPLWKFVNAALDDRDWPEVTKAGEAFSKYLIALDGRAEITAAEIERECQRFTAQHGGLDLVVIDYLQLMKQPHGDSNWNRTAELTEITRALKVMARRLHVPVLAGAQLNRELEKRQNKRPILADLRESGSLEQDADIVLFLYRDEVYHPKPGHELTKEGTAEIIIAKNRNGPKGKVKCRFVRETARFRYSDLDNVP